jgi:5-methylcytosine-specific restriction protein B
MPNDSNSPSAFDWVPFYEELADKVAGFQTRQQELVTFLEGLRKTGLTITPLEDKDESGRRFPLTEIDPFTFFGSFNRGVVKETRIAILQAAKMKFKVSAAAPTDFAGVPILNNQKSWFFAYQADRKPGDIDRLWAVFTRALGESPITDPEFVRAFDDALMVRNTNVNLTMGLFWIRPKVFVSLDSTMREHLKIRLPNQGLSFQYYRRVLEQVLNNAKPDLPHLSNAAWIACKEDVPPGRHVVTTLPQADLDYWLVGAYWDGEDSPDQTERFLAEGVWENGYEDRYLDLVRAMKVGDKIAIKSTTTQKNDLPFDSLGHTVSLLLIKATGTVVSNPGDGRRVEVEWEPSPPTPRAWYFYTSRLAVWRLRKEDEFAQRLIRFAFGGEEQDYNFFIGKWCGEPDASKSPRVEVGETAEPYAAADLIADGVFLSEAEIKSALRRLSSKKNLILQGAPGVGKTFVAKRLAYALMEARDNSRITMIQFHPSYSYEDLVRGYRPTAQSGRFDLADGPFLHLRKAAEDDPERAHILIIDEINRGNVSQIFGELMVLLESDKRGKDYSVTPLYRRSEDERLYVPANLYVIGTMNIADRSLALVDYALRRRFAYVTLEPRYGDPAYRKWLQDRGMKAELCATIIERMLALNKRISEDSQLGDAFRVGHSFFCPTGKDLSGLDESWYREIVDTEIGPLLEEYWYDDPAKAKSALELL